MVVVGWAGSAGQQQRSLSVAGGEDDAVAVGDVEVKGGGSN